MNDWVKAIILGGTIIGVFFGLALYGADSQYHSELSRCKTDLSARGFSFVSLSYHYGGYECWGQKPDGDPVRIW